MENTIKEKTEVQLKKLFGPVHDSQRGYFAYSLFLEMERNENIYLLLGDLGYKVFDAHLRYFPNRVTNCGAAEIAMLDIAVGLASKGKIPFCYSITPFLILRPFETLRTYLNHEKHHVILVGSGRDNDYKHDGISHSASDIPAVLTALQGITQYYPKGKEEIPELLSKVIREEKPAFISLCR